MTPRDVTDVNASVMLDKDSLKRFPVAPDDTKNLQIAYRKASNEKIDTRSVAIAGQREAGLLPALRGTTYVCLCSPRAPASGPPLRLNLHQRTLDAIVAPHLVVAPAMYEAGAGAHPSPPPPPLRGGWQQACCHFPLRSGVGIP